MTVQFAQIRDDVKLRYKLVGRGPRKVVFVMGLAAALEAWHFQLEHFGSEELAGQYQVCAFDNRGAGKSSVPALTTTVTTLAEDLLLLLEHLKWSEVHLVGISMGGMISLQAAVRFPDVFSTVTVINTHAGGIQSIAPVKGVYLLFKVLLSGASGPSEELLTAVLELLYGSELHADADRRQMLIDYHTERAKKVVRATPKGVISHFYAVATHFMFSRQLNAIKQRVPFLVCVGDDDVLVRPSNSHTIARLTGARLERFPGVGHGMNSQVPDKLNEVLEHHFESNGRTIANSQANLTRYAQSISRKRLHWRHFFLKWLVFISIGWSLYRSTHVQRMLSWVWSFQSR